MCHIWHLLLHCILRDYFNWHSKLFFSCDLLQMVSSHPYQEISILSSYKLWWRNINQFCLFTCLWTQIKDKNEIKCGRGLLSSVLTIDPNLRIFVIEYIYFLKRMPRLLKRVHLVGQKQQVIIERVDLLTGQHLIERS